MSALACLRIDVTGEQSRMPQAALAPLVKKFASAYLETRWSWPRQFSPLMDFCFLLVDPRSETLDVEELRRLSDELQRHLFGEGDQGEVALLVFEGGHAAVTAFASMDHEAVAAAVEDPAKLPPGGRLTRIVSPGPEVATPAKAPEKTRDAVSPSDLKRELTQSTPAPRPPAWEGVQGVYFTPREIFYADLPMFVPASGRTHLSLVDGVEHLPVDAHAFDAACLEIVLRLLAERPNGSLLFVPISFSSLARPTLRIAYQAMLMRLPANQRGRLAATIYDVPRDPAFNGLSQARALLEPHVAAIDLRITDPGFEIEKLSIGTVASVTLLLPEGDALQRMSALRRFADHLFSYKQRRIWPAVTNVRRASELEMAQRLRIPFVTGPAVCAPVTSPVAGRAVPIANLPLSLRHEGVPRPQIA